MFHLVHLPVTDDHVGLSAQDGGDELRDVASRVLIIGVGVDDDVGPERERSLHSQLEGGGEAAVSRGSTDVLDSVPLRDLRRSVGGTVVDDQDLHLVDPLDHARDLGERFRKGLGLVEAGDLDDELHHPPVKR